MHNSGDARRVYQRSLVVRGGDEALVRVADWRGKREEGWENDCTAFERAPPLPLSNIKTVPVHESVCHPRHLISAC